MPLLRDRVKDTTTSTGTGNLTLSGTSPTGFQSFNSAFGLSNLFTYAIVDSTSGLWETGVGKLLDATTLTRDTAYEGSSGIGVLVSFTAGTKDVFCSAPAMDIAKSNIGRTLAISSGMAFL